jgi:hypothetical protein
MRTDVPNRVISHPLGGLIWKLTFNNGYGASVACHQGSYGGTNGLFEVAVVGKNGELDYSTPVTAEYADGVIGWLTFADVDNVLQQIENL